MDLCALKTLNTLKTNTQKSYGMHLKYISHVIYTKLFELTTRTYGFV